MKFSTLVILPLDADTGSEQAIAGAVRAQMWPFRDRTCIGPEDDDAGDFGATLHLARWDGCSVDEEQNGGNPVPVAKIDGAQLGYAAIVTPDGEWIDSPATRDLDEAEWRATAAAALARYAGHRAVMTRCRG